MADPADQTELVRSLGRVVRGLSALFWGLPLSLVLCVQGHVTEWLRPLGLWPPLLAMGLLLYALIQLEHFQSRERVWRAALERAKMLALVNIGLAPFLYWWNRVPDEPFLALSVGLLAVGGVLFLISLNSVLQRLTAMLPDEALRGETRFLCTWNRRLLALLLVLGVGTFALLQVASLPGAVLQVLQTLERDHRWLALFLVLLPLSMTMALVWKVKEVIFTSAFGKGS
jgi:hypothetical protein